MPGWLLLWAYRAKSPFPFNGCLVETPQDLARAIGASDRGRKELAAFVATPEGVQWLHQLVVAAHVVITLQGGAEVRLVCQFLELSGLSAFVGARYGTQQALNVALEAAVVATAREQRALMAVGMPHRAITAAADETFHPQILLVMLEPVSKAERLTIQFLATITFFFATVQAKVEALNLSPALEHALLTQVIPALYLERVAARSTHAEPRHRLRALSRQLLEPLGQPDHPLNALSATERARLEHLVAGPATYGRFGPALSHAYAVQQALAAADVVAAVLPRSYTDTVLADAGSWPRLMAAFHAPAWCFRDQGADVRVSVLFFAKDPRAPGVKVRVETLDDALTAAPDVGLSCRTTSVVPIPRTAPPGSAIPPTAWCSPSAWAGGCARSPC